MLQGQDKYRTFLFKALRMLIRKYSKITFIGEKQRPGGGESIANTIKTGFSLNF